MNYLTPSIIAREFILLMHNARGDLAFIPRATGEASPVVTIRIPMIEMQSSLDALEPRLSLAAGHLLQSIEDGQIFEWADWLKGYGEERFDDIELRYRQDYSVSDNMVVFNFMARKIRAKAVGAYSAR